MECLMKQTGQSIPKYGSGKTWSWMNLAPIYTPGITLQCEEWALRRRICSKSLWSFLTKTWSQLELVSTCTAQRLYHSLPRLRKKIWRQGSVSSKKLSCSCKREEIKMKRTKRSQATLQLLSQIKFENLGRHPINPIVLGKRIQKPMKLNLNAVTFVEAGTSTSSWSNTKTLQPWWQRKKRGRDQCLSRLYPCTRIVHSLSSIVK